MNSTEVEIDMSLEQKIEDLIENDDVYRIM